MLIAGDAMLRLILCLIVLAHHSLAFADGLEKLLSKSPTCEGRIYNDQLEAIESIHKLKNELKEKLELKAVKNSDFHQKQIEKALKILDCSTEKIDDVEFVCEPDKACINQGYIAHTAWKGDGPLYFCDKFWKEKISQSATIIHELTHKCGTLDLEYNEKENGFRTYPRYKYSIWGYSQNADNYDYWAREGVCLPEIDCPKNETDWKMLKDIGL